MTTRTGGARGAAMLAVGVMVGVSSAGAQSIFDSELRLAPQFVQYRIKAPANETISELAIPIFVSMPLSQRFTIDIGTSYARARITSDAGTSALDGLTDTQLRGNYTLGNDNVVLTAGLNLPTGNSSVTLEQFAASSRIGSDFLAFPISNMGTGFAATGGIAVARPLGDWNIGAGAAVRRSTAYEPFNIANQSFSYQPGNEYRGRIGADRTVGAGRLALGLTYSTFGADNAGGTRFSTGDRIITQTSYSTTVSGNDVVVGAYDVFRTSGYYASGTVSGRENILNAFGSVGLHPNGVLVEPTLEVRHWQQSIPEFTSGSTVTPGRGQSSYLGTVGVRTRLEVAGVSVFPGAGFTLGSVATFDAAGLPAQAGLTGFRAQLAMRATPFGQ